MKKSLLALTMATMILPALAATTTNVDTTNVSITSTPTSTLRNIIKDTSLSLATGFERTNVDTESTAGYLNLSVNKKFSEDVSVTFQLRSDTDDVNKVSNETPYKMIDPRIFINAYNTEFATGIGAITLSPQLRIQPHTKGNNQGNIATLRLGATASMSTSIANSVSLSSFIYDNITDESAESSSRDESHFYVVINDSYAMNDKNSLSLTFEYFTNIDQAQNIYRSVDAQDDLTLTYVNSSFKNVMLAPYVSQDLNKTTAFNMLELGVDLSYTF